MQCFSFIHTGFHNLSESLSNRSISLTATALSSVLSVTHLASWTLQGEGNWLLFGMGAGAGIFLSDRLQKRLMVDSSSDPACDNVIRAYYSVLFGALPAPFITFSKTAAFCLSHSAVVGLRTGTMLRHLQYHIQSWNHPDKT